MIRIFKHGFAINIGIAYISMVKWTIGNYFGCTNGWYLEWRVWGWKWRGQHKLTNREEHMKMNQVK